MKSAYRFLLFTYFILLILVVAFYACKADAQEDSTASISIMDSGFGGIEVIEITCRGETFSTNVPKIKLASSLHELEAYVDEKCKGKKK